ncbi:hypothetical protein K432DRAFT_385893 [Lepidopterella palustris CBS 459.81]|uniref:Uncharacterized protein n=1 Tax=Lepidopterella palustris CBS 459.81 TaxID=1314670 RepID=A0A8E2JB07_9PEZI|nr:hypothetical protein K432DRAFT_385893 [Lepidopterella palustris CBS 459.81]
MNSPFPSPATLERTPDRKEPPPLSFSPWTKTCSIINCTLALLFFDVLLPCLLYYVLQYVTNLNELDVLGIACLSLGLGELMELPVRGYRLVKHRQRYGPLGSEGKWEFDSLFWYYSAATIVAIIPYVLATDQDNPIYWLFLYTPGILTGFCALPLIITIIPFPLPFRISSDAKGVRCKPAVYYVVEDFIAVDAGQGRSFREEWRARYDASPIFRKLIWEMNLWWILGCGVFMGALAGVTWGVEFAIAYGVSLALIFIWIGVWALLSWGWVRWRLRLEREWFLERASKKYRTGNGGVVISTSS